MAKKNKQNTTGQYDKVFKENSDEIYASVIKAVLHIDFSKAHDFQETDLQRTTERKPDFLKIMSLGDGTPDYALHIEIQSQNDLRMHKRMWLYNALIYDRHDLETAQFVIYIGKEALNMQDKIEHRKTSFSYEIIDIARYDYKNFLYANTPEEVILAILGDFQGEAPAQIIAKILTRLQELTTSLLDLGKYTTQLDIISELRGLEKETYKQINDMPVLFDYTRTIAYQKGEAKGEAKGELKGEAKALIIHVEKLLKKKLLTPEQIAEALEVELDFVLEIKKSITKN